MVRHDNDHVGVGEGLIRQRDRGKEQVLLGQLRHERIVVRHVRAIGGKEAEDIEGGRFPDIVHVTLVGYAEHQDARAVDGLLFGVQSGSHLPHHELGHLAVDLRGQLDEAGPIVERTHLPRQILGIDGNAVPSESRSGHEFHEAERLRGRRLDDLPHVHVESVRDERQLVHQRDIDGPERIFQDLDHLRGLGGRDRHHRVDEALVERQPGLGAHRRNSPDDLRGILRFPDLVSGVHTLGRKAQEKILAHRKPGTLEHGKEYLPGRAGIGRRLQNDELPGAQRRRHGLGGGEHEGDVGIPRLRQRGRHRNRDGVALGEAGHIGRGLQPPRGQDTGQFFLGDVVDVAGSAVDAFHGLGVDVEPHDPKTRAGDLHRQR